MPSQGLKAQWQVPLCEGLAILHPKADSEKMMSAPKHVSMRGSIQRMFRKSRDVVSGHEDDPSRAELSLPHKATCVHLDFGGGLRYSSWPTRPHNPLPGYALISSRTRRWWRGFFCCRTFCDVDSHTDFDVARLPTLRGACDLSEI